ncbi:MAG: DUF2970 domain-containing protein [Hylemonella sp.]|nr:DUF2970 domain-containing protein [Hylemonella sp.]
MNEKTSAKSSSGSTLWQTVKAVGWSFLGIRKSSGFQDDIAQLKPYHILAVGFAGGLLFVLFLIAVVNWVVAK